MKAATHEYPLRRRLRFFTRLATLGVVAALALSLVPGSWAPLVVPAASPYVAVFGAIAARAVSAATLIGLPLLILALFFPRWFCRYGCPVGLMAESLARVRPSAGANLSRWPQVGRWLVFLTLGTAIVGYPVLLWLDPLAMLGGFLGAWRGPITAVGVAAALGLPLVAVVSVLFPHAWCGRLCPLGAAQDLLALPLRTWRLRAAPPDASPGERGQGILRRAMLFAGLAGLVAAGLGGLVAAGLRTLRGSSPAPLRPPGAIEEDRFTGVCVRCGNCARACPARIIRPDPGRHGLAGILAPVVSFDDDFCREDCNRCQTVCPSGAIRRLSLEEKRKCVMGLPRVDLSLCLLAKGQECSVCTRACPYDAVAMVPQKDGPGWQPAIDRLKCTGCGACQVACPTSPRKAVEVFAAPEVQSL
jgi:formate hydrogenlyase subunit 6/NADH:ubiquinone oxidoreductase subunit I